MTKSPMDQRPPSSFIPKQYLAQNSQATSSAHVGIFLIISLLVFLATIALGVGVFLYTEKLGAQLNDLNAQIAQKSTAFDLPQIEEIKRFEIRLNTAQSILRNHIAFSHYFKILEDLTIPTIFFERLDYSLKDGLINVELVGEADGFSSVALQSDAFMAEKSFSSVTFSDFDLKPFGAVGFKVSMLVNPRFISYQNSIASSSEPVTPMDEAIVETNL